MVYLKTKILRRRLGLSQEQLGKIAGVSASAIGMYEQGRREPNISLLVRLSEHFKIPIDELVEGGDCGSASPLEKIDDRFSRLCEDGIECDYHGATFTPEDIKMLYSSFSLILEGMAVAKKKN